MTSDRDELAKQIHLSRHGGGSWVGAMDDDFDFIDAMEEADFVMASDWLARVKREAAADAWDAGARWAYEEITGEPEKRFELAPGDNPHRADEMKETP